MSRDQKFDALLNWTTSLPLEYSIPACDCSLLLLCWILFYLLFGYFVHWGLSLYISLFFVLNFGRNTPHALFIFFPTVVVSLYKICTPYLAETEGGIDLVGFIIDTIIL